MGDETKHTIMQGPISIHSPCHCLGKLKTCLADRMLCMGLQAVQTEEAGPKNVVVVGHSIMTAAMLGHCLGLGQESMSLFKTDCGGITVVDFPHEVSPAGGVVQCVNYTAHLGRWSVPITNDDMDSVCGIEGCF